MHANASHSRWMRVRMPLPSLPRTRIVGASHCSSCDGIARCPGPPMAAPTTRHPFLRDWASVLTRLRVPCTGISSIAPAEALDAAGERRAELRLETRTPAAPRKWAERKSAPMFCGSWISSSASQTGGADPLGPPKAGSAWSESSSSGSAASTTPWCGRLPAMLFSSPLSTGSTGSPASRARHLSSSRAATSLRALGVRPIWM
mmetsp:Transcript_28990/g.77977  ORF Transcript_28990/g.77977 Transcript_28990/m.77977 type:complete len:203 (+) Transcript_28990:378-986(+)